MFVHKISTIVFQKNSCNIWKDNIASLKLRIFTRALAVNKNDRGIRRITRFKVDWLSKTKRLVSSAGFLGSLAQVHRGVAQAPVSQSDIFRAN